MPITNTFETYDAVGNREDLTDLITNISPVDTPFYSDIAQETASAVFHEWQTDELAAAAANARAEGEDSVMEASDPTTREGNYTQIQSKNVIISGTQDAVDKAGRDTELAYQVVKKSKELARDVEFAMTQNENAVAGSSGTAREMMGLKGWIETNVTDNDGSPADELERDHVEDALEDIWIEGGNPGVIMVGSFNKRVISGFTEGVTKNLDANDRRFVAAVDVYESDWGVLKVVPNRFQDPQDVFLLQMDLWACATLRPLRQYPLAKTGDAEKRELLVEHTLVARQEKGNGAIINTNIGA